MKNVEDLTSKEVCEIYRSMMRENYKKSFEERKKAINDFRSGKF